MLPVVAVGWQQPKDPVTGAAALLFVAGVMNMLWVAAITILVLLEKVARKRIAYNPKGQVYWRKYYRGSSASDVMIMAPRMLAPVCLMNRRLR